MSIPGDIQDVVIVSISQGGSHEKNLPCSLHVGSSNDHEPSSKDGTLLNMRSSNPSSNRRLRNATTPSRMVIAPWLELRVFLCSFAFRTLESPLLNPDAAMADFDDENFRSRRAPPPLPPVVSPPSPTPQDQAFDLLCAHQLFSRREPVFPPSQLCPHSPQSFG